MGGPCASAWGGRDEVEDGDGSGDNTVMLGELVRAVNDRWQLGVQFGQLEEDERMLDASGGGALGLPEGASTTFLGFTGRAEWPRVSMCSARAMSA